MSKCRDCQHSRKASIGEWKRINNINTWVENTSCLTCEYNRTNSGSCELFDNKNKTEVSL